MTTKEKVIELIVSELGVDAEKITEKAHYATDLGADSLDVVELIFKFEEAFGIEIPDEDTENLTTVGDSITYIESKL